ncbi:TPA: hypothetical protein N0F65_004104 [Lagenidium giganteum]|uniref:Cationic amino acid transporter C-terminal domain-containing protein n=1 Tax=Lagenidium giganteum TaxID=4803 RepID=A0AAV2ZEH7_9STRA|nr:TPA: hypothetical protein N0F65_004104 [Lagenidium giganteum]
MLEAKTSFLDNAMRTKPLKVIRAEENSQDLPRSLSLFDLLCIGIGGTVGSGIFATTGVIISQTAGPAAVLSWVVGGLVCCINAFAYMELTTRVPSSGSTYAYAYHAIGELPAVIGGWLLTLEYAVSGAGVARSWAGKVESWLNEGSGNYHWLNEEYYNLLAAAVQALCVAILLMGMRFGKMFINTVTVAKLVIVAFIIFAGFSFMSTDNLSPFIPERREITLEDTKETKMAFGYQGVITGASQAFFGYIGFDEVCCLAAEAKNPKKVMPLAVIGVVVGTMILSVLSSLVLAGMVPGIGSTDIVGSTDFSAGFNDVNRKWAAQIVHVGETVTMPVVVLIAFLAQPRLNYAMACDGLLPQIFAKVDEKGNLYVNTMVTGAFFTAVAFFVPFSALWDIVSFGILLSFVMSNASLLMIRTRDESPQLAPRLILAMTVLGAIAGFLYQVGYTNNESDVCLYLAIVFAVAWLATTIVLAVKCPQKANDPGNFSAPLVPFLPALSILLDWYLIAQISPLGLGLGCAWVGAAILSYLLYGYHNAVGRTGWSALMTYLPRNSSISCPMLSMHDVKPSMSSLIKEHE